MDLSNTSLLDEMLVSFQLLLSGMFSLVVLGLVALLMEIWQFVVKFHIWLVAAFCEVEGHIKKVDDLFVSINCDFKAIRFEHLADFFFGFFKVKFKFQVQVQVYYYFSISFGVTLQIARPSSQYGPTSF